MGLTRVYYSIHKLPLDKTHNTLPIKLRSMPYIAKIAAEQRRA